MTKHVPPPADPAVRALIQLAQSGFSRRRMLGLGGSAAALAALSACAPPPPPAANKTEIKYPKDVSASEKIVNWANWTLYLDVDDNKNHPSLDAFTKKTGIKVSYEASPPKPTSSASPCSSSRCC